MCVFALRELAVNITAACARGADVRRPRIAGSQTGPPESEQGQERRGERGPGRGTPSPAGPLPPALVVETRPFVSRTDGFNEGHAKAADVEGRWPIGVAPGPLASAGDCAL